MFLIIIGSKERIARIELSIMKNIMYLEFLMPNTIGILLSPTIKSPFKEIIFFTISLVRSTVKIYIEKMINVLSILRFSKHNPMKKLIIKSDALISPNKGFFLSL
ncbi:hypothetical protein N9V04_01620 [Bacteroidota bacterium]|nr:hypothetical protein [Bacteroidota bacterium]